MKELRDPAYTLTEAERAAGLGTDNRQRGVEEVVKRTEGMAGVEEGQLRDDRNSVDGEDRDRAVVTVAEDLSKPSTH